MKRSGKFYRRNESEIMIELGLKPTKNSGSGWIEKEDGQNEKIICQLKSTDANSIKINKQDIDTLLYNANVSHKIPVFAINFLSTNETYLVIRPEDLEMVNKYITTGEVPKENHVVKDVKQKKIKTIKSSAEAREQFNLNYKAKFKKEKNAK